MAKRIRRTHSPEFKLEAVRRITTGGETVAKVAGDLDLNANLLSRWKAVQDEASPAKAAPVRHARSANGKGSDEVQRLRSELSRMKHERDVLKQTVVLLATAG